MSLAGKHMHSGMRINLLNTALIVLSCILGHFFPYSLLLFSYAVLGPAHYLTQISWLHDKRYFVSTRWLAPLCIILTLFLIGAPNRLVAALMITFMFSAALIFVAPATLRWRVAAGMTGLSLIALVLHYGPVMLFTALILPSVIHIFVFTACFMWVGAIKSRSLSAYLSVAVLVLCALTFLYSPVRDGAAPLYGLKFFQPVVRYLQQLSPLSHAASIQLFGFLAFAYTYHYLNWFSKAEIIHWHRIPRRRLTAIILLYMLSLGIYMYDYETGLLVLLFLSQLHVVLEFPLNLRTFSQITGHYRQRFRFQNRRGNANLAGGR